jgi:hypothetical protein
MLRYKHLKSYSSVREARVRGPTGARYVGDARDLLATAIAFAEAGARLKPELSHDIPLAAIPDIVMQQLMGARMMCCIALLRMRACKCGPIA